MNLKEIQAKARTLAIKNYSRMKKQDLIRAIQLQEGHTDCYGRIPGCGQMDCCWRDDCQEILNG